LSDPGWTRTTDPLLVRQLLLPLSHGTISYISSGSGGNRTPNGAPPRQFSRLRDMPVSTLPSSQLSAARNDRASSGSKPDMFPVHHAELLGRAFWAEVDRHRIERCSSDSESEMLPVHQRPMPAINEYGGQAPGRPIRKVTLPAALPSCESWNRTSGERV
jgi:hypothetical protein